MGGGYSARLAQKAPRFYVSRVYLGCMAVRAIILDLYGVLGFNGWQSFKLQHFANRPGDWQHLRALGKQVDEGEASQAEFVAAVARATGEPEATVRYQFEHTLANKPLLAYITERLKPNYKLGLLSNASRDVFGTIFAPEELAVFDVTMSSFHVGLVKPDLQIFQLMCERLAVRPDECLMIDDTPRHLTAAAKLGMRTVRYETFEQTVADIEKALER